MTIWRKIESGLSARISRTTRIIVVCFRMYSPPARTRGRKASCMSRVLGAALMSLEAKGILSTGVGGRCDYLFLDDPSDQKNSYSPTIRRSVRERYNLTWRTRVEPWGKVVCIATPYHEEDLVHWIAGRETTCTLRQWISDDYGHIAFEVTHAPDDAHPLLPYRGA
jgi:hypothetical protein